MKLNFLEFEQPIAELEAQINELSHVSNDAEINIGEEIDRPKQCHVRHLDYNGQPQELNAEGLLATCIQHEIDHLEGILFIDYLSKLKKEMIIKKLSKQTKESVERIVV